jgi:hypothetical protein
VIVEVELRLLNSNRSSIRLVPLGEKPSPYKLDPRFNDGDGSLQLFPSRRFSHSCAISGPTPKCPLFLGGGKGGGGGSSLRLGIDIGVEDIVGVIPELWLLDLLAERLRSEGLEP